MLEALPCRYIRHPVLSISVPGGTALPVYSPPERRPRRNVPDRFETNSGNGRVTDLSVLASSGPVSMVRPGREVPELIQVTKSFPGDGSVPPHVLA
jgi:hypothetical protein